MEAEELRLDGNAAAGMLSEVLVPDATTARARCAGCGAMREMGALLVYAHGMGMVMRCPSCDAVLVRMARMRQQLWVDLSGVTLIVIPR
jgi:ribosomal protein S27E